MTRLVVVGAGITGLAAAWEATGHDGVDVVVLEAADRCGGKIRTSALDLPGGPLTVDEGADAFLARVPDAVELCQELGLGEALIQPAAGRAKVFVGGELRFFPHQHVLGIPLDLEDLAATGILGPAGLADVARDLISTAPPPVEDVAIGPFLTDHFGPELVDHLVGPLIGGINVGDVRRLSLTAVTPQLAAAAAQGGSLIQELRRRAEAAPPPGPVFSALPGGTESLIDELVTRCRGRGVDIRTGASVTGVAAHRHGGTRVNVRQGNRTVQLDADIVVVATPAPVAATMLRPLSAEAADELETIEYCSVALVTMAFDRSEVTQPLDASGFLVPRDAGLLLTAASWGSTKWTHWTDGRHVILRVSAGHADDDRGETLDDDQLVSGLRADLATTMGLDAAPVLARVSRWHHGFAQYTVGHLARADRIDAALRRDAAAVRFSGAAMRGVGIPACIRQGREAVRELLEG